MPKPGASDEPTEEGGSAGRRHVLSRHGGASLGHATRKPESDAVLVHSGECLSLGRESSGWFDVHGHAEGFFEGGESFADFGHRVVAQGDGPVLGGVAVQGFRGGLLGDEGR